jgi:hypothetical protein
MVTQDDRLDLNEIKRAFWDEPIQMVFGEKEGYRILRFWKPGCGYIYLRDDGLVGLGDEAGRLVSWQGELLLTLDRALDGLLTEGLLQQADEEGIQLDLPEVRDGWWYRQLVNQMPITDE